MRRKKRSWMILMGMILCALGLIWKANVQAESVVSSELSVKPMYRLYNRNSGEHFYTYSVGEKNVVIRAGWEDEGIGWYAPSAGDPVYRLYNKNGGEHHYTMKKSERDMLVKTGWKDEGVGWYSDKNRAVPLYRQYNPNAYANNHNYTANQKESRMLISLGWKDEGIAWYGTSRERKDVESDSKLTEHTAKSQYTGLHEIEGDSVDSPKSYEIAGNGQKDSIGWRKAGVQIEMNVNGMIRFFTLDFTHSIENVRVFAADFNVNDGYRNILVVENRGVYLGVYWLFVYNQDEVTQIPLKQMNGFHTIHDGMVHNICNAWISSDEMKYSEELTKPFLNISVDGSGNLVFVDYWNYENVSEGMLCVFFTYQLNGTQCTMPVKGVFGKIRNNTWAEGYQVKIDSSSGSSEEAYTKPGDDEGGSREIPNGTLVSLTDYVYVDGASYFKVEWDEENLSGYIRYYPQGAFGRNPPIRNITSFDGLCYPEMGDTPAPLGMPDRWSTAKDISINEKMYDNIVTYEYDNVALLDSKKSGILYLPYAEGYGVHDATLKYFNASYDDMEYFVDQAYDQNCEVTEYTYASRDYARIRTSSGGRIEISFYYKEGLLVLEAI